MTNNGTAIRIERQETMRAMYTARRGRHFRRVVRWLVLDGERVIHRCNRLHDAKRIVARLAA